MQYLTEEHYEIGFKNGLKKPTIYRRVYQYGWSIEDAISKPVICRSKRSRKHPKKYTDLALANGICLVTFYSRLKKGWSYEEASTLELGSRLKRRNNYES